MSNSDTIMHYIKNAVLLIALQLILDQIYVFLYPTVSPIRATLIGVSALVILFIPPLKRLVDGHVLVGFLSIYSSALFGALLVQADLLVSKSALSAVVHVAILIVTYSVLMMGRRMF